MANLTQTAANVGVGSSNGRVRIVQAGEAITKGMPIYESAGKWFQADANVQAASQATAIAMSSAGVDGWIIIVEQPNALVNLGATLVVGETYVVSATKGAICPIGDLTTGDYPCILGTATTTALLRTVFYYSGAQKP
ncbi:hypothetical protein SH449x_000755 [Pirellulaceae bacterium SH449]